MKQTPNSENSSVPSGDPVVGICKNPDEKSINNKTQMGFRICRRVFLKS